MKIDCRKRILCFTTSWIKQLWLHNNHRSAWKCLKIKKKKKIKKNLSYSHYKTGIIYFPVVIRDYNLEWSRDVRRHITNHYE